MGHLTEEPTAADLYTFLSTVTRQLSTSLDINSTLATVSKLALPYFNSWCVVDIAESPHETRRIAVVHPDPVRQAHARHLLGAGSSSDAEADVFNALVASATPIEGVPASVTDDLLANVAKSGENLEDLRAMGIGAVISVPLIARSRVMGAITFVSGDTGHRYCASDISLAEDLAARCAMALDNARLYTEAEDARELAANMNERLLIATLQQQDLTEEARDANLAKSQFLAMMSHELRTPLNAVVGYADLIALGIAGPVSDEQRRYIRKIHTSTYHLVGIIDDILDLAKIQAGRMQVYQQEESAEAVIADSITLVATQAAEAGIHMHGAEAATDISYFGDEKRVRQILVNLLSNSVKFTGAGGEVVIWCECVQPCVEAPSASAEMWTIIRVTDTGVGISESEMAAIFEPFVQLGGGKRRTKGGTGLGLTISRELARRMGGDLTVASAPGAGSTFALWLPASSQNTPRTAFTEYRVSDRRVTVQD